MQWQNQIWQRLTMASLAVASLAAVSLVAVMGTSCWLGLASPALAIAAHQWQLTGESADGSAQQYVALDSIRPGNEPSQWIVDSYFTERKFIAPEFSEQVRADYITLYDCDRQRYKDINADGSPAPNWGSAAADPLNQATLEFVCKRASAGQG